MCGIAGYVGRIAPSTLSAMMRTPHLGEAGK